jgi:hypothetical protein
MAVTNVKTYQTFRGVDYSASPAVISEEHASDILNMYNGADGTMQKRPGWHILKSFGASNPINGIHYIKFKNGRGAVVVHAGTKLYWTQFCKPWRNFWDSSVGDVPAEDAANITAAAATLIMQYIQGINTSGVARWELRNMDLDGDGVVTYADAQCVLRKVVGHDNVVNSEIEPNATYTEISSITMANAKSVSFEHDGKLYLLDGEHYIVLTANFSTTTVTIGGTTYTYQYLSSITGAAVTGYIPTTGVNGHYEYDELNEEGTNTPGSQSNPGTWTRPTLDEDRNLIQTKQINTFTADGIHKAFYLLENNCEVNKVELLLWTRCKSVNGADVPTQENIEHVDAGTYNGVYYYYKYIWTAVQSNDATYGWTATDASSSTPIQNDISYTTKIQFTNTPAVIDEGAVNIRVTYTPRKHSSDSAIAKDTGYIYKCTICTKYGYFNNNRYFFAGNPEHKNMDFMSAVDDPTYFPNTGWTLIGSGQTAIMGYLHYGTELAIVKEDNEQDATIYMRSAIRTDEGNIIFPLQQGAQGVGAISPSAFAVLHDDPLFLAKEGVFAVEGTSASQERNIPNRSFFVDSKLCREATVDTIMCAWGDYLLCVMPSSGRCFVADARYQSLPPGTNGRSRIYEWYLWDNIPAISFLVVGDHCMFGTQDGRFCMFSSDWLTPKKYQDGAEYVNGSTKLYKWRPYDGGVPIHAYYVTKRDHLDAIDFKKTMLNDGGVIALKPYELSSAAITVTTDRGEWFVDQIATDSEEPSVVIPIRHRFKNFDSIETRIENNEVNEGLSILTVQYRYAITTNRR